MTGKHGGARKGAGRPKLNKVGRTVRLTAATWAALDECAKARSMNRGQYLEWLLSQDPASWTL